MKTLVIDLGCGNIRSLTAALTYLGVNPTVTVDSAALESASHVILPGVGAFDAAMKTVAASGLHDPLRRYALEQGRPLLGVCLGMQLLFEGSEEGVRPGLALLPGRFRRLIPHPPSRHKVPHVGFSTVCGYKETGLFKGLGARSHYYFTHSFALSALGGDCNVATCDHTAPFVAAFQHGNICGAQFHPEKSQSTGLRLLSNFLEFA